MERIELCAERVFVPRSLGIDAIGADALADIRFGFLENPHGLTRVIAVEEKAIERLQNLAGDRHFQGFFLRDEPNRLLRKKDEHQGIEHRDVVPDE